MFTGRADEHARSRAQSSNSLRAGLAERVGGLDADLDWAHTLSLGEQQRIAFLRLLVHRPAVAVLDGALWLLAGQCSAVTAASAYFLDNLTIGCASGSLPSSRWVDNPISSAVGTAFASIRCC